MARFKDFTDVELSKLHLSTWKGGLGPYTGHPGTSPRGVDMPADPLYLELTAELERRGIKAT